MQQVTPEELRSWLDSKKDFLLIDIREGWERELYNIGGMHIPMGQVLQHLAEIPKDKEVVMYCERGIRSTITIQRLEAMGYHNICNLAGGMKAWKEQQ